MTRADFDMASLRRALSRLRDVRSVSQLLERAPLEACRGCGFERAMLLSVRDSNIAVESVHFEGDPEWAAEILELAHAERPRLKYPLVESEVVRRRAPVVVPDAQADPRTIRPFVEATRTRAYVAAPVIPEGKVFGILEADCYFSGRALDALDRDALWTFAEGFACALERTVLLERLRSHVSNVETLLATTMDAMTEVQVGSSVVRPAEHTSAARSDEPPAIGDLTAREVEVLALMAEGSTNAEVASRLVITESTVKSHVKHILRKLGATNRAEAVSRYLLAPQPAARTPGNGQYAVANGRGEGTHR